MIAPPPPFTPLTDSLPPRKNWFARNWKWFVPTIILAVLLLFAAFVGGVFALGFGAMKSSEPYQHAMDVVSHDPRAVHALGNPVRSKWYLSGSVNVTLDDGNASLAIPLVGKSRNGTLSVVAKTSASRWSYDTLELEVEGQTERIDFVQHHSGTSGKF